MENYRWSSQTNRRRLDVVVYDLSGLDLERVRRVTLFSTSAEFLMMIAVLSSDVICVRNGIARMAQLGLFQGHTQQIIMFRADGTLLLIGDS